jgi:hypothetical protein
MAHGINLMSDRAQFRAAAERLIRGWSLGIGAMILTIAPVAAWTWQARRGVAHEQEALEARYEPIRRLAAENRRLNAAAVQLVQSERTALELSQRRPVAALLAVIGEAVAEMEGNVFITRINLTQTPANVPGVVSGGQLILEVSSVEGFDVARLVRALERPPLRAVKVLSSEADATGEVSHDRHSIECTF